MPESDWLNQNAHRFYPFVPTAEFTADAGAFDGKYAFADAGFTLGISSAFSHARDAIYLQRYYMAGGIIRFVFRTKYGTTATYEAMRCYEWVFEFPTDAPLGATVYTIPTRVTDYDLIGEENPAMGMAFLTVGDLSVALASAASGNVFILDEPEIEPALVQSNVNAFMNSISLANEERPCPPECVCPSSSAPSSSLSSSPSASSSPSLSSSSSSELPGAIMMTVGDGGDFATWGAAILYLGSISPLNDDYEFVQISDTTEVSYSLPTIDINGHTVICRNASPHNGNPKAGYKCYSSGSSAAAVYLKPDGTGMVEVKDLNIQFNSTVGPNGVVFDNVSSSYVDVHVHDIIARNQQTAGQGIKVSSGGSPNPSTEWLIWNVETYGWNRGLYTLPLYVNVQVIENSVFLSGGADSIYIAGGAGSQGLIQNCVADSFGGFNLNTVIGNNNASVDATAQDANWKSGSSGNVTGIILANEFVTTNPADANFVRVKSGGSLDDGGIAPWITENVTGIRGNDRPHDVSDYSIGADEYAPIPATVYKTVGVGGDYASWGAAVAGLAVEASLLSDYELLQISDTIEDTYSEVSVDINGHTVLMHSASPHGGDPTAGYKCYGTVSAAKAIHILSTGAGSIEVKDLNIQFNAGSGAYGIYIRTSVGADTFVHDIIAFNEQAGSGGVIIGGYGVSVSTDWQMWNVTTNGWLNGASVLMIYTNPAIMENCTCLGASQGGIWVWGAVGSAGIIQNCVANTFYDSASASQYIIGNNNASVDSTAADGNWEAGSSGNEPNITLANEFVSTDTASPDFTKVRDDAGGVCFDGGTTPLIAGNTKGIRGNSRPHSPDVSIGSDEFLIESSASPSPSSSPGPTPEVCVDPTPPEPGEPGVPIRVKLPDGRFVGAVKLKPGYNCIIDVDDIQNLVTVQSGLNRGEGMQCEDLRTDDEGNLIYETCRDCSGLVYAVNGQGFAVEQLQLVGGQGVLILPDADNHRIVVRFEEEGICQVEV